MKPRRIESPLSSVLGFLAVAAALALASPGVRIAQASDDEADTPASAAMSVDPVLAARVLALPAAAPAPSCDSPEPGDVLRDDALLVEQLHEVVRRAAARQAAAPEGGEQGIVLNGRGYNYRPTPVQ